MSTINHKIACLSDAAKTSPEYAGIVPLFVELFRYLEKDGRDSGITFKISRTSQTERVQGGFPLLSADDLIVDLPVCRRFLKGAIDVLKRMGSAGDEGLVAIVAALDSEAINLPAVFRSILERNRSVIDDASEGIDVPAPLLEYICELPLKNALEQFACGVTAEEFEGWQESYCPVCGSRAGMAELSGEEGRRSLCCSACTFRWPFKRIQCPFCGNEDVEKLSYFTAGEGATRVDTCKACSRYIKTRDARKGNSDIPLDVEDLLTMHLDLLAAREGLERGK
ncbi:MAG: formate dehydrogenase accessory protein FdhE [Geobacteraceae bacterium]|nr:formate dehydrogenase accessory protein FdhE [Geobacteraceae bacterium]